MTPIGKYVLLIALPAAALFLIRFLNVPLPLQITTSSVSAELSVVGEGQVDVVPDTAYVDVGISVENLPTADEAQKQITDKNNALVKALKELNIKDEDIKTSNFSVNPNYVFDGRQSRPSGYNGQVSISIKARQTADAAKIIELATRSGANQIQGARFVVDSPEKYREAAREKAIANAREQADKLAGSLGIKLGRVTNIVESSPSGYPPIMYAEKAVALDAMGGGRSTPNLEPGSQTITSVVTLYFEKR